MKLAIVGFGLIGSSLARAAQKSYGGDLNIAAIDPSVDVLAYAQEAGLCQSSSTSISAIPKDCDWVILAAPVAANLTMLDAVIATVGPHTFISDAGSTKATLVDVLNDRHPDFDRFIPAHPMAGREVSGHHRCQRSSRTLFIRKLSIYCIFTFYVPRRAT